MEEKDHLSVTGDSDSNTITLDVSGYGAAQPAYIYDDMGGTNIDLSGIDTITLPQNTLGGAIDLGSFSNISVNGGGTGGAYISSTGTGAGMQWTTNQWSENTVHAATIKTAKGSEIDIDELADLIKVLKERLLVITPNFEMHEKYPMLKELYDEYKAMEKLLSGPDRGFDEE